MSAHPIDLDQRRTREPARFKGIPSQLERDSVPAGFFVKALFQSDRAIPNVPAGEILTFKILERRHVDGRVVYRATCVSEAISPALPEWGESVDLEPCHLVGIFPPTGIRVAQGGRYVERNPI